MTEGKSFITFAQGRPKGGPRRCYNIQQQRLEDVLLHPSAEI